MKDSTENSSKPHGQSAGASYFPFYLPISIFQSLLQALMAIFRLDLQYPFYFWKPYRPISSSPKFSGTGDSDMPSTVTDRSAPVTLLSRGVPGPPRSSGGRSRSNRVSRPPRSRGRGGQTN